MKVRGGANVALPLFIMLIISPILRNYLLRKYLNLVLSHKDGVIVRDRYFQFRCLDCGDSHKNKFKKRGYLLFHNNRWSFKCHNCSLSISAEKWLKKHFPIQYKQYIVELLQNREPENNPIPVPANVVLKEEKIDEEKIAVSSFVSINKGTTDIFTKAKEFCLNRKIPENIWKKWFVSTKGKYGGRLILPFFDDEQKIYFYQARTLCGQTPKYLNRVGDKQIYNIYNVDKSKPIQVCEGPIDSCFLSNAIAILGCSLSEEVVNKIKQLGEIHWLFDFDEAGIEASKEYLTKGESVFLWKKFSQEMGLPKREKFDINDVILFLNRDKPFEFKELKRFYSSSIYDKIWL